MISRRGLLISAGLAGSAALGLRPNKLGAQMQRSLLPAAGEAVDGFLLLPDGAPTPREVVPAWRPMPDLCNPDEEPRATQATSEPGFSVAEVAERSGLPLYEPDLPMREGSIIRHPDGEVFSAMISFDSHDAITGKVETNVCLTAMPDYPQPLALWETDAVEPGGPVIRLSQAPFLPVPGVMARGGEALVFHWIAHEVYYMFGLSNRCSLDQAKRLLTGLSLIDPRTFARS